MRFLLLIYGIDKSSQNIFVLIYFLSNKIIDKISLSRFILIILLFIKRLRKFIDNIDFVRFVVDQKDWWMLFENNVFGN